MKHDYNTESNVEGTKRKTTVRGVRTDRREELRSHIRTDCEVTFVRIANSRIRDFDLRTPRPRIFNRAHAIISHFISSCLSRVIFLFRAPLLPSLAVDTCKQNSVHPF